MNVPPSAASTHLTTLFQAGTATGATDGALLDRFRSGPAEEAEAAFAALVERHGAMVFRVCRRVLGNRHDAEDAAQAVFLALARQARSIRRTDSIASWLHGVAARVAARARLDAARRRLCESRGAEAATAARDAGPRDQDGAGAETWAGLYEELDRLPERFRLPIFLCHLEGLTYEQAARRLGCPVRTIQSRLARARARLRDRLARRGLGPSALALVLAPSPNAGRAPEVVLASWKHATVQAAARCAAGGAPTAVVDAPVAALAEGVLRAMYWHELMKRAAALLLIGVAAGAAGLGMRATSAPPTPGRRIEPGPAADDGRYRAAFQSGATIEVVGVSTVPTGPNTWWKPDGSPLAEAPVDAIGRKTDGPAGSEARLILLRVSGLKGDDYLRWHPERSASYWGGRSTTDGRDAPGLEYYEAVFQGGPTNCKVQAKLAAGPWKTVASNDGKGGVGTFVDGRKFSFGRARPYTADGRSMTVFSVAHNYMEHDRRIVAIDLEGRSHPAVSYSSGSDGDKKWVLDLIDAEFPLPPDQIREYQVQFRPFEVVEIRGVALNPRPADADAR